MNASPASPRARLRRGAAIVALAAAIPVLWVEFVAGPFRPEAEADLQFVGRLVLLSTVFWACAAHWLTAGPQPRGLGQALLLGLFSPALCLTLAGLIGVLVLPVEWLLTVGLAMGFVAWAIATLGRGPAAPRALPA
jgi:hypothetical protein